MQGRRVLSQSGVTDWLPPTRDWPSRSWLWFRPTAALSTLMLHLVFTLPALLFSPIGEEIFCRGLLQRTFAQRFSVGKSTQPMPPSMPP